MFTGDVGEERGDWPPGAALSEMATESLPLFRHFADHLDVSRCCVGSDAAHVAAADVD